MEESVHTSDPTRIAVLDHARTMVIHASELRMKNFNFFLVIMGVIVAAYVNVGPEMAFDELVGRTSDKDETLP